MNRKQLLEAAEKLVNGSRAKDYGDAFENHDRMRS